MKRKTINTNKPRVKTVAGKCVHMKAPECQHGYERDYDRIMATYIRATHANQSKKTILSIRGRDDHQAESDRRAAKTPTAKGCVLGECNKPFSFRVHPSRRPACLHIKFPRLPASAVAVVPARSPSGRW